MIQLHTFDTPNGRKISVALEEMGLPYTVHTVDITKDEQFKPDFLKLSPNNKIPAILDTEGPDAKPVSVFESGAMPGQVHHFLGLSNEDDKRYGLARYMKETRRLYGVMDQRLANHTFFAGEISIADFAILGWAWRHQRHQVDLNDFPNVKRWYDTMMARPAVQRGFAVALK